MFCLGFSRAFLQDTYTHDKGRHECPKIINNSFSTKNKVMVFCLCTAALLSSEVGMVLAPQLHPRPAFLPIFNYPGVTRYQDGGGRLCPL